MNGNDVDRWFAVLIIGALLLWAFFDIRAKLHAAADVIDAAFDDDLMDVADAVQAEDLLTCEECWSLPVVDEHTWGQR